MPHACSPVVWSGASQMQALFPPAPCWGPTSQQWSAESGDLLRAGSGAGIPHVPPHRATAKPSSVSCHVQSSLLGATTSALLQEPTCGTSPLGREKRAWVSILTALMSLSRGAALALLTPSHSFTSLAYCGIFCPYKLLNSSQTAQKQQQASYIPRLLQCPKCDLKHNKLNGLHVHLL